MANLIFDQNDLPEPDLIRIRDALNSLKTAGFFTYLQSKQAESFFQIWDRSEPETILKELQESKQICRIITAIEQLNYVVKTGEE